MAPVRAPKKNPYIDMAIKSMLFNKLPIPFQKDTSFLD